MDEELRYRLRHEARELAEAGRYDELRAVLLNLDRMRRKIAELGYPALDEDLDPPFFGVDGHSHFPIYSAISMGAQPSVGLYSWKYQLLDTQGNGWKVEYDFVVLS